MKMADLGNRARNGNNNAKCKLGCFYSWPKLTVPKKLRLIYHNRVRIVNMCICFFPTSCSPLRPFILHPSIMVRSYRVPSR